MFLCYETMDFILIIARQISLGLFMDFLIQNFFKSVNIFTERRKDITLAFILYSKVYKKNILPTKTFFFTLFLLHPDHGALVYTDLS